MRYVIALFLSASQAFGAHLAVGPSLQKPQVVGRGIAQVRFDLSWDDAWKNDINCDGVWVFAKFRVGDGEWRHASLQSASPRDFDGKDQSPVGFSRGQGQDPATTGVWIPESRRGFFAFRTRGQGGVRLKGGAFTWDYARDGVKAEELRDVGVRLFGLEMVYVPEGAFYLGDPQGPKGPDNCFFTFPDNGAYRVPSEKEILVDAKPGSLFCNRLPPKPENSRDEVPFVIPDGFPKGFKAFWCMKFELSTQNYVDFLNTLTRCQQGARVSSDIRGDRVEHYYVMTNTKVETQRQPIFCQKSGHGSLAPIAFFSSAPARACSMLSWVDVAAYADWAALRPITELEFEKACRGTAPPVPGEYAWGTTRIGRVDAFDGADGSGFEKKVPVSGLVNCAFEGGIAPYHKGDWKEPKNPGFEGPVSCGLFAQTRHPGIPVRGKTMVPASTASWKCPGTSGSLSFPLAIPGEGPTSARGATGPCLPRGMPMCPAGPGLAQRVRACGVRPGKATRNT